MGICETYTKMAGSYAYVLFRALVGLLFFLHGWMKFSGGMPAGTMLVAGVLELGIGVAVFLGFFVRGAALLGAVEMVVAYFMAHFPQSLNPLANNGEPAVLFFAAFLALSVYGAGKWGLEQATLQKETF